MNCCYLHDFVVAVAVVGDCCVRNCCSHFEHCYSRFCSPGLCAAVVVVDGDGVDLNYAAAAAVDDVVVGHKFVVVG